MKKLEKLFKYKDILNYLKDSEIRNVRTLDSVWRSGNTILLLDVRNGKGDLKYVFKALENPDHITEIKQIKLLSDLYHNFMPNIHCIDNEAILMDYIDGNNMFSIFKKGNSSQISKDLGLIGSSLSDNYQLHDINNKYSNGLRQIDFTLNHYGKKCLKNNIINSNDLINLEKKLKNWEPILKQYPSQIVHNDLNIANVILRGNNVTAIDPEFDDSYTNDVAKDIGRFSASLFFNSYDYYLKSWSNSMGFLDSFYSSFSKNYNKDDNFDKRVAFYIAQSSLSFSNFKTNGNLNAGDFLKTSFHLFSKDPTKIDFEDLYGGVN